ncbi:MAG: 50S ribosomal protein L29 [Bacteroidetes bacterium]|nr:50S ribosomal protein L29 [Bacteroidota bacterium]
MKAHDLRQLSDAELQKRIQDEEENLSHLRFQKVIGQLENPMKLGHVRKTIARIKTILRDRQLNKSTKQPAQVEQQK